LLNKNEKIFVFFKLKKGKNILIKNIIFYNQILKNKNLIKLLNITSKIVSFHKNITSHSCWHVFYIKTRVKINIKNKNITTTAMFFLLKILKN